MATARYKAELSPYKVCVCILIYESLANSAVQASTRLALHSHLTSTLFRMKAREPTLAELMLSLDALESPAMAVEGREPLSDALARALRDIEHCNELIILFNSRLTELRSDAEINLGYMDEGGVLYLFLRKCLVAFAALDFEGLIRLFDQVKNYKAGAVPEDLPDSDLTMLVSYMAENLSILCTQQDYAELTQKIAKLPPAAKWLLQAHLDSFYSLPSAVDHLHRHFDQDLEKTLPPASLRVSKNPIAKSFTYYASLHRVKIELQLNHLETAVHLLVETVKRELSEGDSAAILESSLLFCRIAGLTGSWAQERSLSEKCVLRALEKKHPTAIVLSALNCAQLDCIYAKLASADILKAVAPKDDPSKKKKKPQTVAETKYFHDASVTTGTALRSLALHTMLDSSSFAQNSCQLLQTQVLTWLAEGNLTAAIAEFSILLKLHPRSLRHRDEVQLVFSLVREAALHRCHEAKKLLDMVDQACPIKECIEWGFTCDYVCGLWSLLQGKFEFAEFFERRLHDFAAGRLDKFYAFTLAQLKARRLVAEDRLQEAQVALTALSSELKTSGWLSLQISAALLHSEVYLLTGQHVSALQEVLRCLPLLRHARKDKYAVRIQLAEVLWQLYPNSLKALFVLHRLRPLLMEEATQFCQGKFFVCRAKCRLSLARSGKQLRAAAVQDLNEALQHFQAVSAVVEARSTYYLLARALHEMGVFAARDSAAAHFNALSAQLNLNEKEVPNSPTLSELCKEVHFPRV